MNKSKLDIIKKKLGSVYKYEHLLFLLEGMSKFILLFSASALFAVLIEYVFQLNSTFRTLLFVALLFVLAGSLAFYILPHLIKITLKQNRIRAAQLVGEKHPEVKDDLLNALQLIEHKNSGYSESLIEAAFNRIYDVTQFINFNKVVDFSRNAKRFGFSVLIFTIASLVLLAAPGLRAASVRILNFHKDYIPTPKILFEIHPGDVSTTKGENVRITVDLTGEKPSSINLHSKTAEQINFTTARLTPDSLGLYSYQIKNISSSTDYYVSTGGIESRIYKITVIDRPVINKLEIAIAPPSYSGISPSFQKDNGNITALAGSELLINIGSTKPLENASITFSDSTKHDFNVINDRASISFKVMKDDYYFITIVDKEGNMNADPIQYSIAKILDEYPEIEIITPEKDIMLTADNKINVTAKIDDDFGFTKMNLAYRLSSSKYEEVWPLPKFNSITINTNVLEDIVYYVWDIEALVLAEGDVVTYYLEIFDNDMVSGPKSTKSGSMTLRVPSIDDLFGDLDKTQESAADDLEKVLKEAKELKDEFEKLSNELKQDARKLSWEEKEKIEKAVERFEEMSGSMAKIKEQIADLQKEAMQNNLLSEKTLEKYNELQKLMDEIGSDELSEALKKMQDMLQQLNRNQTQQSFEDMKASEKLFQKSIERTINLLKRIQVEQKVDELIKRTEELKEKIAEAENKTAEKGADPSSSEELSQRQKDITEKINKTDNVMNDLQSLMNELGDMPVDEMNKIMEEFQKQKNDELSKDVEQNLRMQQPSQAMENQQQLSQNMQTLSEMLKNLQQSIQQQNQMEIIYEMMKIIDNLLIISKEEEKLKNESGTLLPASKEYMENAKSQSQLIDNLDKVTEQMAELSQKTFAITPEMGKAVGTARWEMQQSITLLQNRQGRSVPQLQTQAMSHVNEAALLMKSAMDMMMSGGQGGGMMSMMQQLQQMSQQQMSLNQMTKMLNQGGLSQQQMAQLQRLANEQAMIQKSLEQLSRESRQSGQSKKLAGNLERILKEMQEVIKNMNSGSLDDEVILKQERILSRLLDAQRSMNERDYDDKRESQSGTNITRQSPGDFDLSSQEGRDQLRDELIRALKEGYKKDYENLIRKYFEALEKENL